MGFLMLLIILGICLSIKLIPMRMEVLKKEKEDIIQIKDNINYDITLLHKEVQVTSMLVFEFFTDKINIEEFIVKLKDVGEINLKMIENQKMVLKCETGYNKKYTTEKHIEMGKKGVNLLESCLEFREVLLEIQVGFMKGIRDNDDDLLQVSKNSLVELLKQIEYIAKHLGLDVA